MLSRNVCLSSSMKLAAGISTYRRSHLYQYTVIGLYRVKLNISLQSALSNVYPVQHVKVTTVVGKEAGKGSVVAMQTG